MVFVCWKRPSPEDEKNCVNSSGTFNYDPKYRGATANPPDSENGFSRNHTRLLIGSGLQTYEAGKKALQTWRHFGLKWAFVNPKTRIKTGEKFCVCTKQFVPWFVLPLQIVYVNEKNLSSSIPPGSNIKASFGFGSGTLHGHLLAGEERFCIELDEDNKVWFEIFSFSKPAHFLSYVGYPFVLFQQKQFSQQSTHAILQHVTVQSAQCD